MSFWKAGHKPTLFSAFLYFDLSFMVWVLLGPLAVQIAFDLNLTSAEKGLMVATPVLSGAFLRILMGILVEQFKPKMAGVIGQIIVIVSLFVAWFFGVHSFQQALILGGMLGFAGASFAVSLPLASRWYPPEHQGTALGIAGAGNSGTVFAALFAPSLAVAYGWNNVLGLAVLPLVVVLIIYLILAKDSPDNPPAKSFADYVEVLKDKDSWWFMFFYCVTFGGFVGMASSLTIYFNDQYALSAIHAGYFTAACVFAGSLVRPIGGFFSDRFGGIKTLSWMYAIAATFLAILSLNLNHQVAALIVAMVTMIALGMGNGAVFQLVPQRFRKEIGIMTGIVGMAGGVGGFYLASSLGFSKQITGSYSLGLIVFSLLALVALVGLTIIKNRWRTTWGSATVTTAKI
ncbi:MAG: NarK/NasA family nitrate transporter [Nitrosomonadales bacterium]|jgi:NNP family nitrate/nitrite transporter-like MFS transporter|nr:NarK/NasA family nitrate transporter [Nitrosomonadales bacterium]MBT4182893.1 NarK/NasA family nitrate transporter [Nitrosomonadales bacterium]MBT4759758.1 NarK/NasA family nitrate transporter [Nitrosomonadales bacterium]MBT6015009.1 NarK/NasA family nitrate transporter [Nitrosomonadales bacterium]